MIFSTSGVAGGKELQHIVHATTTVQHRAQNKQGVRDLQGPAGEKGSLNVSSPSPCSRRGQIRPRLASESQDDFLALILCIKASLLCLECLFFCLLAM